MSLKGRYATLTALGLLALSGVVFYLAGFPGRRPAPQPLGPPARVQRFEKEPTISLFLHETGERREMPIEEYVAGVVAGEMWERWPENAYAAQAILARTFTLEYMARGGTRDRYGTDMSTDPSEGQAYNAAKITDTIRRAVESTRGQVLTYQGRYARAWFHAYSGGQTTTPEEGLGLPGASTPYLRRVKLPDNPMVPQEYRSWRAEFTRSEVEAALKKAGAGVGALQQMRIRSRGPTGRITQVEAMGSEGRRTVTGNALRLALGPDRMRSTLVSTFQFADGRLVVEGKGSGHGVGLSQWDALLMATQGRSPQAIVQYFYPGTRIEKLW